MGIRSTGGGDGGIDLVFCVFPNPFEFNTPTLIGTSLSFFISSNRLSDSANFR